MAHTFLIYDFGTNEETAQQARRKVEGWKQGFRLGDKILVKFEREESSADARSEAAEPEAKEAKHPAAGGKSHSTHKGAGTKKKSAEHAAKKAAEPAGRIRLLIRLDFSDHEKLSHNRWIAQIPAAEPFKSAKGEIVRSEDPAFDATSELFDSLDRSAKSPRSQAAS